MLRLVKSAVKALIGYKPAPEEELVIHEGGSHPGKRFLVIQRNDPGAGLLSHVCTSLGWIDYADRHGMIPVVDMATYANPYQQGGRDNAWEWFFCQPGGYCLKDIADAEWVKVVRHNPLERPHDGMTFFNNRDGQLDRWHRCAERFLHPSQMQLSVPANDLLELAFSRGQKVVGVLARGTDYAALHPREHPVIPTADEMIADVQAKLLEPGWADALIYLVTEDSGVHAKFHASFGERIVDSRQEVIAYGKPVRLSEMKAVRGNVERGQRYLKAVRDLVRCDFLFAARTSGSVVAAMLTKSPGKYYDLGRY